MLNVGEQEWSKFGKCNIGISIGSKPESETKQDILEVIRTFERWIGILLEDEWVHFDELVERA
jgi:hypothetical protein